MNKQDSLVAGLLAAGLMAVLVPFASLDVDFHHDGIMLKPALDVLSGQVLFRDTFMQYGALTCYLQALALWVQPALMSIRLLTVLAYGITLFFLYASWRLILPRSLAIVSAILFILFIPAGEKDWLDQYWKLLPWSSVYAMMFECVGVYALLQVIRGEQPVRWGIVLGLATACTLWCRQPVGVIMAGCLVAFGLGLHWTKWTPARQTKRSILSGIATGFVAVNVLLLGGVVLSGALPEWYYQNLLWPRKWMLGEVNANLPEFFFAFVHPAAGAWLLLLGLSVAGPAWLKRFRINLSARSRLVYYLGLGCVLFWQQERLLQVLALRDGGWTALIPAIVLLQAVRGLILLFTGRGTPRPTESHLIAALATLSFGSLLQYYPVPDSWHILWSLAPAFGLLVFVFWRWLNRPAWVVAIVLSTTFLPALQLKLQSATQALNRPLVTLTQPAVLRGMRVSPAQARTIGLIADCLAQVQRLQPGIPGALIGNDALYLCFLNNRANPSPYYVTWPGLADNAANQNRWNNIQRVRPLMILHKARWDAVNEFYQGARYVPLLYVPEEALEIAVPEELAAPQGWSAYKMNPAGPAGPARPRP